MPAKFTLAVSIDDDGPAPEVGEAFYVSNDRYLNYAEGLTGFALPATVTTDADGGTLVTMPDGLSVRITRVPLDGALGLAESKRTQLSVFVNTEDMDTDHRDGKPLMQVVLNDATLYDVEPAR